MIEAKLMNLNQLERKIAKIDPNLCVYTNPDTNQPIEVFAIGHPNLDLHSKIVPLLDGSIYKFSTNEWNFETAYEYLNLNQMYKLQSLIKEYRR